MSHVSPESFGLNLVVLYGEIGGAPTCRDLPSGSTVVHFDLQTRIAEGDRERSVSVPTVAHDPTAQLIGDLQSGGRFVVVGCVKRRFFRVGAATQARTEVVADSIVPIRRRRQVERVLAGAVEALQASTPR